MKGCMREEVLRNPELSLSSDGLANPFLMLSYGLRGYLRRVLAITGGTTSVSGSARRRQSL